MVIFFRSLHQLGADQQAGGSSGAPALSRDLPSDVWSKVRSWAPSARTVDLDLNRRFLLSAPSTTSPIWWKPDGPLSGQQVGERFADLLLASLAP